MCHSIVSMASNDKPIKMDQIERMEQNRISFCTTDETTLKTITRSNPTAVDKVIYRIINKGATMTYLQKEL